MISLHTFCLQKLKAFSIPDILLHAERYNTRTRQKEQYMRDAKLMCYLFYSKVFNFLAQTRTRQNLLKNVLVKI